jgi:hypothetical protein
LLSREFGLPWVLSEGIGVGNIMPGVQPVRATSSRDFGPWVFAPVFGPLHAVGVGIKCEDPSAVAPVGRAGVVGFLLERGDSSPDVHWYLRMRSTSRM